MWVQGNSSMNRLPGGGWQGWRVRGWELYSTISQRLCSPGALVKTALPFPKQLVSQALIGIRPLCRFLLDSKQVAIDYGVPPP